MNSLDTTLMTQSRGLDAKALWKESAHLQARGNVQINAGRQQQAVKEDYFNFFLHRNDPADSLPVRLVWETSACFGKWYHDLTMASRAPFADMLYVYYVDVCADFSCGAPVQLKGLRIAHRENAFLQHALELESRGHLDAALDILYDKVDELLKTKNFGTIDQILTQTAPSSLSVDMLLGLLTATLPAKSKLMVRPKFFLEVEASIKKRGEWEEGLLTGLES